MDPTQALQEILGANFSKIDETTLAYAVGIVEDADAPEDDIVGSLAPLLQGALDLAEAEADAVSTRIVRRARGGPASALDGPKVSAPSEPSQPKLLQAPLIIAKITDAQDAQMKNTLKAIYRSDVNTNETIDAKVVNESLDTSLDDRTFKEAVRSQKKSVKRDKKDTNREARYAQQRDEMLLKLSGRPVKLHSTGTGESTRQREIRLEGVSMNLTGLELLEEASIVFSDGRRYGLIGRNGVGKTTFLKHLAGHAFKGIPQHLQILHIEQEVAATDISVLDTVLQTDVEREALYKELRALQQMLDADEAAAAAPPPAAPVATAAPAAATPAASKPKLIFDGSKWIEIGSANEAGGKKGGKGGASGGKKANNAGKPTAAASATPEPASTVAPSAAAIVPADATGAAAAAPDTQASGADAALPTAAAAVVDEFGLAAMTPNERVERLSEIYERLADIDADTAESRASSVLSGLGFTPELQRMPTKAFSGGWRMRLSIAQALFISPDCLLLDEPTNHLDLHSVLWLEDYLLAWPKMLLIVSHDRDFLNTVSTDIVLFKDKKLARYKGNYDNYEKQRSTELKNLTKARESQEKIVANLQTFVDKNRANASTAKMAQSRLKQLSKIDVLPEIASDPQFQINIPEPDVITGPIIQFIDVGFGYTPDKILYTGVNCTVDMSSHVALVGANGVGKSTLLKLTYGELQPMLGMIRVNPKARIARFSQHHVDQLDMKKSPFDWFKDMYPETPPQEIRKHLGGMGLGGKLALQPIYSLSGGQKSRVALAHVTWKKPQLILLDEPTNHLDMETIDSLILALNKFSGGVLIISHDEHLITSTCEQIWVCGKNQITAFNGDFEDYKKLVMNRTIVTGRS
eukprot:TRINITY_DN6094_c0_g1_i3.p1 TRINITY_DN6094_c0_g1~~TRINITY_DN6094_c0_g1_i3.p1  ORF type:complete len:864 (-),score=265.72 TRINITY_DN6094_c0_g1_i3:66-2657(-)